MLEKRIEALAAQPFLNEQIQEEKRDNAAKLKIEVDTLNVKCVEKTKEIHILKDKVQELLGTNATLSND